MIVESFPDGRQTFPRLTGPPRPPRTGPPIVVTTPRYESGPEPHTRDVLDIGPEHRQALVSIPIRPEADQACFVLMP